MEKIIDTITIEGVEFTVIEKPRTIYAGFVTEAPDFESEPDGNGYQRFEKGHERIVGSVKPECMVCLSIEYREWNHDRKRSLMHCKETASAEQPEGITVLETPPCLLIRVQATDAAWTLTKKVTGMDNPMYHMAPLFHLTQKLLCMPEYGFVAGSEGNHEVEYYYFDGSKYTAIPVHRV